VSLFATPDRRFAQALSEVAYCNPFLPRRVEFEQAALGADFDPREIAGYVGLWSALPGGAAPSANVLRLRDRCKEVLTRVRPKLAARACADADEQVLYEDLVLFMLYHDHWQELDRMIHDGLGRKSSPKVKLYDQLVADARPYLHFDSVTLPLWNELAHMLATFFQIRRAFQNIFMFIVGASRPAVQLRAAVWQSIFTHDLHRYRRVLYHRMADYTTLVTGPSGTGKELVARAVGLSRYIPFDSATGRFTEDFAGSFLPLNLSALSPTLIESELFGHKRGAFTGAVEDRQGWLEVCPPQGTVFLDEIGELDPAIQVKLLRVLQERNFSRLGETTEREFKGKLIAATNRDLADPMRRGEFREDLYYRLCSDIIVTPSLAERLADDPDELGRLVLHIAQRMVGDEAEMVAAEVLQTIETQLGRDYAWPGNVRELEQCVRNVLIRKEYRPPRPSQKKAPSARETLLAAIGSGNLSADELLAGYCTLVYAETHSYEATARRLGIDRRTVKAKVDPALLENLAS
jgi:transcriptional regulator with AAA-type ATPase domain